MVTTLEGFKIHEYCLVNHHGDANVCRITGFDIQRSHTYADIVILIDDGVPARVRIERLSHLPMSTNRMEAA